MSYANGTTHYNLPQTVGTDKRDWFDTNQAFADVDAALHTASETASGAASDIVSLGGRVTDLETASGTQAQDIVDIKADILSQGGAITRLDGKIDGVKADALDMICAVDEGTAQVATVAVSEGKYFRYNDVLYIATDDIAIGDTIVPNTNCKATNVATELETLNDNLSQLSSDVASFEKNELGTAITITEGTTHTCATDGYLTVTAPQGGNYTLARVYGSTAASTGYLSVQVVGGGTMATDNVFVRKGMRIEFVSQYGGGTVTFTPIA